MPIRETSRSADTGLAQPLEQQAVLGLTAKREAPLSDAPLYTPQAEAASLLLGALLAAPKKPKEPKAPKKV